MKVKLQNDKKKKNQKLRNFQLQIFYKFKKKKKIVRIREL